jgi:hypothetical protein
MSTYEEQTYDSHRYFGEKPARYGEQSTAYKHITMDVSFVKQTLTSKQTSGVVRVQPVTAPECFDCKIGDMLFHSKDQKTTENQAIGSVCGLPIFGKDPQKIRDDLESKIDLVGQITIETPGKSIKEGSIPMVRSTFRIGGHDNTINNGCYPIKKGQLIWWRCPLLDSTGNLVKWDEKNPQQGIGDRQYGPEGFVGGYYKNPGL